MALVQMEHPILSEHHYVISSVAGLKDGIKDYLILHSPQTLCDTYWKEKELEKGILVKKFSLLANTQQHYSILPHCSSHSL